MEEYLEFSEKCGSNGLEDSYDNDDDDDYGYDYGSDAAADSQEEIPILFFAYMLANYDPSQKINTYIGKSRNPNKKVTLINQKKTKGSKSTRQAAGNWELQMIIGPFVEKQESINFREHWKQQSRGIKSRIQRGITLAKEYDKMCWDSRVIDDEGMDTQSSDF